MGALARYRALLLNQYKSKLRSYQAWVLGHTAEQMAIHPGLTVGATQLVLGERIPAANGETDGEVYVSNDLAPLQAWIWQGAAWEEITGGGGGEVALIVGTTHLLSDPPPVYYPTSGGTEAGQIYISSDLVPAQAWVWQTVWVSIPADGAVAIGKPAPYYKFEDDSDDSGLYREIGGGAFPTAINWYTSAAKTTKVRELLITRDGNQNPTTVVWKYYVGGVLARTTTDTILYTGAFETSRTRSIS